MRASEPALDEALVDIQTVRKEIAKAADAILDAVEAGLARLADLKAGDKDAPGEIENALCAILGACEFQDLTGQRLTRVEAFMTGDGSLFKDPLAFGPARQGEGLDQGAADALFAEHFPVSS